MARCAFKVDFTLLKVPNSDTTWTSGGTLAFTGIMSVPLEPAPSIIAQLERTATLAGETTEGDATLQYHFVTTERRQTTPGEALR
jgi:hypothetical protein